MQTVMSMNQSLTMMKEVENNNRTPLQLFLATTIVASNRDAVITLVSDTAKTISPKSYGNRSNSFSSLSDSSVTSSSPNKKSNSCRWGETSSLQGDPSPSEASPSLKFRTVSDLGAILPTSDVNISSADNCNSNNGEIENNKILQRTKDSAHSPSPSNIVEKYNSVCSPSLEARTKLISRTSTMVKEERAIQSSLNPISITTKTKTTENHYQKVASKNKTNQASLSMAVNKKGNDNNEGNMSMDVEKGQAIIEKVIELSRKAALAMTQDEATTRLTIRSATSA